MCRGPGVHATHDDPRRGGARILVYTLARNGKKAFAQLDRDQRVLAVRSNDPIVQANTRPYGDPHVNHNWVATPLADVVEELPRLLAESKALARLPRGGVPAPEVARRPHPILSAALAAATPAERPPGPPHLGGPNPVCPAAATVEIAIWVGELALATAFPEEHESIEAALQLARDAVATEAHRGRRATDGRDDELLQRLEAAVSRATKRKKKKTSPALRIGRQAAAAAAAFLRGKNDIVWVHPRASAARIVPVLRQADSPALPTVQAFLEALDQRIVCAEMATVALRNVKARAKPPPRDLAIARVLYRGPEVFLGQLPSGAHALVAKQGRSWTWTEGSAAHVLACVPDAQFAEATAATVGLARRVATRPG